MCRAAGQHFAHVDSTTVSKEQQKDQRISDRKKRTKGQAAPIVRGGRSRDRSIDQADSRAALRLVGLAVVYLNGRAIDAGNNVLIHTASHAQNLSGPARRLHNVTPCSSRHHCHPTYRPSIHLRSGPRVVCRMLPCLSPRARELKYSLRSVLCPKKGNETNSARAHIQPCAYQCDALLLSSFRTLSVFSRRHALWNAVQCFIRESL